MSNTMQSLVGKKIISLEKIHDYWQISVDNAMVNIYNPIKYCKHKTSCYDLNHFGTKEILSHIIVSVVCEPDNHVKFELKDKSAIIVSLEEKDFVGPEAISLHFTSGEVIVFQ